MSIFSKTASLISPKRLITLPVRTVIRNTGGKFIQLKDYTDFQQKAIPYCPRCMSAKLKYDETEKEWFCPTCEFVPDAEPPIKHDEIARLRDYVRRNGAKLAEYYDTDFSASINKRVLLARLFGCVAIVMVLLFLYHAISFHIFASLIVFMLIFQMLFLAGIHGYRAWQLKNHRLFMDNSRQQFLHYLTHNNYFAYPQLERLDQGEDTIDDNSIDEKLIAMNENTGNLTISEKHNETSDNYHNSVTEPELSPKGHLIYDDDMISENDLEKIVTNLKKDTV